jgi:hypothetical protein
MRAGRIKHRQNPESGVALLISIFVLLIISVVAILLVIAAGSESSLAGNYRSSAAAYFAGTAGLEEARGRLLAKNADYFNKAGTVLIPAGANFIPTGTLNVGEARYILNPAPGESTATLLTTYPDTEFATEFGAAPTNIISTASVSTVTSGGTTYYGPLYKWVRITAATERSTATDVDSNGGAPNNAAPLYYDMTHLPAPSMFVPTMVAGAPVVPATARQVYEVTTLAILPNGTTKLLQYLVAAQILNLNFPSALTMAGSQIAFGGANSNQYFVNGTDGTGNPPPVAGCTPTGASLPAIGVTGAANITNVVNPTSPVSPYTGIPSNRDDHYLGGGLAIPSVSNVAATLSSGLSTPSSLDALVQTISNNADVVVNVANATESDMPAGMSVSNPMTVVVNGNFAMNGNFTGYGLLVVTGNFSYTGNTGWKGIVLVIGDGTTTFLGSGGGNNEFDGAIFAATTRSSTGAELATLGNVGFDISGGGGNGIYYNSCWINQANQPTSFRVLSFRELHN